MFGDNKNVDKDAENNIPIPLSLETGKDAMDLFTYLALAKASGCFKPGTKLKQEQVISFAFTRLKILIAEINDRGYEEQLKKQNSDLVAGAHFLAADGKKDALEYLDYHEYVDGLIKENEELILLARNKGIAAQEKQYNETTKEMLDESECIRFALLLLAQEGYAFTDASWLWDSPGVAPSKFLARALELNEEELTTSRIWLAFISYLNFSRLTLFKLLNGIEDVYANNDAVTAKFDIFLDQLSAAGAVLYGIRIIADIAFICAAAQNRKNKELSWLSVAWITLRKDNLHHRMFNNVLWCAIMIVRLTCVASMSHISTYVFCAGYLVDLYQDLWKAHFRLQALTSLQNKCHKDTNIYAQLEKDITTERRTSWNDTKLYVTAFLGTLLGAAAYAAHIIAVGNLVAFTALGTFYAAIPLLIILVGLALTFAPLWYVHRKELFKLQYSNCVIAAAILILLVGIGLTFVLFFSPIGHVATLITITMIIGLALTGFAQGFFTVNQERGKRLYSLGAYTRLALPIIVMGAAFLIVFFPVTMPYTIGVAVALTVLTLLFSYLTQYKKNPNNTFITGMKPFTQFQSEITEDKSVGSIIHSDSDPDSDPDLNSPPPASPTGSPFKQQFPR